MPTGIIINVLSITVGGLIGVFGGNRIPERIREKLSLIFPVCALALGVTLIAGVQNLPPVVLSLILGTAIGELLDLEGKTHKLTVKLQNRLKPGDESNTSGEKAIEDFINLLVLFSLNVGFIFGALYEGMTGDISLNMIKSILDFFTVMILATSIGYMVLLLGIPTLIIGVAFFSLSALILPYLTEVMIADFRAAGGIITFLVGIRMLELRKVPVLNTVPTILLVMPLSYLWTLVF